MPIPIAVEIKSYLTECFGEHRVQSPGFLEESPRGDYTLDLLVIKDLYRRHVRLHVKPAPGSFEVLSHEEL